MTQHAPAHNDTPTTFTRWSADGTPLFTVAGIQSGTWVAIAIGPGVPLDSANARELRDTLTNILDARP